jgi:hypothetical protein
MVKPPRVEVLWDDAHFDPDELNADDARKKHRPWKYSTIGYLVISDAAGVSLAQDVGEDGATRGRTFIPRVLVVEEVVLKVTVPRRRGRRAQTAAEPPAPSPATPPLPPA